MKQTEIRQKGYQALTSFLGVATTLRFLQQLSVGYGDYTNERRQWLDQLSLDEFRSYVRDRQTEED